MLIPPYIQKGDLIGLVSPAGKITPQVIALAESYLESSGFRYLRGENVLNAWHQFGATDDQRINDMNAMIHNPDVKVIWCTRGGYGAMRLLHRIDWSALKDNPKWIVGFSDITAFHATLNNIHGLVSIHGPMPKNLAKGNFENSGVETLWRMLQGQIPEYHIRSHPLNRLGKSKGIIIGGNITLLNALKGSKFDFDPHGTILFIEEVGEYLYHLDRMMQGLKISGKLSGLSGLIVGQMSEMQDNNTPFGLSSYEIIADAVAEYDYPVVFNFSAGHEITNEPLLLGAKVKVEVTNNNASVRYINL